MNYIIVKELTPTVVHPLGLHFLRVSGAMLFFTIIVRFGQSQKVSKIDLLKIAGCSLFGAVINGGLFLKGIAITNPINASLIIIMVPLIVMILSYLLFRQKIGSIKLFGLGLGVLGATILITKLKPIDFGIDTVKGDLYILLNAISFALYLILVSDLMKKYSALTMARWIFTFATLFMLPIGLLHLNGIDISSIQFKEWLLFIYVIFLPTCLAFYLYNICLKYVSATVASSYIFLQPLLTAIIAIALGKDQLDQFKLFGGALIFIGVFLVTQIQFFSNRKVK